MHGSADVEVWPWTCRFIASPDQVKDAKKLAGGGEGVATVIGREDVAGPCPLCRPRWKAALPPVPICLPHAVRTSPAQNQTLSLPNLGFTVSHLVASYW